MQLEVTGEVVEWRGPAPHHFLRISGDEAELVAETAAMVTYGWGMVPVRLTLDSTTAAAAETRGRPRLRALPLTRWALLNVVCTSPAASGSSGCATSGW